MEDPFVMDIIHPYRINLQTSTGGTITVSSSDPQREPAADVTSLKWESDGDFTLTAVANPDNNYSFSGWYEATVEDEGNITGYTGNPLSVEKTITLEKESNIKELYALFVPVIREVSITIDAPLAGDTVTIDWVDPDDHTKVTISIPRARFQISV